MARLYLILAAIVAAGVLTYCTYLRNTNAEVVNLGWISSALDFIQFPAILVGAAFSGNVHQPNAVVAYTALFFLYVLIVGTAIALFVYLARLRRM